MPERQACVKVHAELRAEMGHHRRRVVAIVVRSEIVAVEDAEQHRALPRQNARKVKLIEHPLDPVRMLTDVF